MAPRFSLILPTHNRSALLRHALRSALDQQFDSYEILVSDDTSTDDTPDVVREVGAGRAEYLRTPHRMSMSDHFEWASTHARGEFVMFLCDDDAISPHLLTRVDQVVRETGAESIALSSAIYYHPDWGTAEQRNLLVAPSYTGKAVPCDSGAMLRRMFRRMQNGASPRANNSFCSRELMERIRSRVGRFFLPPAADSSSSCLVLASVPSYVLLDEPLLLFGSSAHSIGSDQTHRRSQASTAFAQASGGRMFELSPVQVYCVANIVVEAYLQARKREPEKLPEVSLPEFYLACCADLKRLQANGVDVSADAAELERFRRTLTASEKLGIQLSRGRTALAQSPLRGALLAVKHRVRPPVVDINHSGRQTVIRGEEGGFSNIYECAQRLPALQEQLCS